MNNKIPRIICSGKNCDKALMKTRLFCSNCCQDYTDSIRKNSKIEIK
jgi:hypothetical protein